MIDGIKIECPINDIHRLFQAISFYTPTNHATGEIKAVNVLYLPQKNQGTFISYARFGSYGLILKNVREKSNLTGETTERYYLHINGSLHKNHFGGCNHARFGIDSVCEEINSLCNALELNPNDCRIKNLEFGVNIRTPFAPFEFLERNLIGYKQYLFNQYAPDKNGRKIGYECNQLQQYRVKIYDKGKQFDLPKNLMRFELRFLRMEQLKRIGVKTLADLLNPDIYPKLAAKLVEAWDLVLLTDSGINDAELRPNERKMFIWGNNPRNWDAMRREKKDCKYRRKKFKHILQTKGTNWNVEIRELIERECCQLIGLN